MAQVELVNGYLKVARNYVKIIVRFEFHCMEIMEKISVGTLVCPCRVRLCALSRK